MIKFKSWTLTFHRSFGFRANKHVNMTFDFVKLQQQQTLLLLVFYFGFGS